MIEKNSLPKTVNCSIIINIYVNGESAYPEELAKPVKDGDELTIDLIIEGG